MPGELPLYVRRDGGDPVHVTISSEATVGDLLAECGAAGFTAHHAGVLLQKDQLLADAGVCAEAVVELTGVKHRWRSQSLDISDDGLTAALDHEVNRFANAVTERPIDGQVRMTLTGSGGALSRVTSGAGRLTGVHVGLAPQGSEAVKEYCGGFSGSFGFTCDGSMHGTGEAKRQKEAGPEQNRPFNCGDEVVLDYDPRERSLRCSVNGEMQGFSWQNVPAGLVAIVSFGYPRAEATLH
eukprot:TRINITY_DN51778_c0_g1_i1.p1 TRINITY_DN51778_c0_g1~~TRINITY_DN51778_c0_g1_i1.p1  ORF type:complete len:259 (+),score=65.19 TRINITY_DN51778_c0_g1_i1:63-779(+)